MGFFAEHPVDEGGSTFVKGDEKERLIADEVSFTITAVRQEDNPFDKAKDGEPQPQRYVVTADLEGEERRFSFPIGGVQSRDRQLGQMAEYLAAGGTIEPVRLEMAGKAQLIVPA